MPLLQNIQQAVKEKQTLAAKAYAAKKSLYEERCKRIADVIYQVIQDLYANENEWFNVVDIFDPYKSYKPYNATVKLTDLSVGKYSIGLKSEVSDREVFKDEESLKAAILSNLFVCIFEENDLYTNNHLESIKSNDLEERLTELLHSAIEKIEYLNATDLRIEEAKAEAALVQAKIDKAEEELLLISNDTVQYINSLYKEKTEQLNSQRKVRLYLWTYYINGNRAEVWSFTSPTDTLYRDLIYCQIQRVTDKTWLYLPKKDLSVITEHIFTNEYPRNLMKQITLHLDEEFYSCSGMKRCLDGDIESCQNQKAVYDSPYVNDYLFYAPQPVETGYHIWEKCEHKPVILVPVDSITELSDSSPNIVRESVTQQNHHLY